MRVAKNLITVGISASLDRFDFRHKHAKYREVQFDTKGRSQGKLKDVEKQ